MIQRYYSMVYGDTLGKTINCNYSRLSYKDLVRCIRWYYDGTATAAMILLS